jgi:hypothetical protein
MIVSSTSAKSGILPVAKHSDGIFSRDRKTIEVHLVDGAPFIPYRAVIAVWTAAVYGHQLTPCWKIDFFD